MPKLTRRRRLLALPAAALLALTTVGPALAAGPPVAYSDAQVSLSADGVENGGDDVHQLTVTVTPGPFSRTYVITYVDADDSESLTPEDTVVSVQE